MDHEQCNYLAGNQLVEIVPNFRHDKMSLLNGVFGPFEPGVAVHVPLWLASMFGQRRWCRILLPEWLCTERLEALLQAERFEPGFAELPAEHFFEISTRLLSLCVQDAMDNDRLKTLLQDVKDLRAAKLRHSMEQFVASRSGHAVVNNLTLFEISTVRGLLTTALHHVHLLQRSDTAGDQEPSQQLDSLSPPEDGFPSASTDSLHL